MRPKHSLNHNIKSVPLVLTGNSRGPADFSTADFETGIAKNAEVLVFWIINKDVSICKEQDFGFPISAFRVPAAIPKFPTNLERNGGLTCTGA